MSKLLPPALSAARRAGVRRCSRLSQRAYEGVASLPCASAGSAGVCEAATGSGARRRRGSPCASALS